MVRLFEVNLGRFFKSLIIKDVTQHARINAAASVQHVHSQIGFIELNGIKSMTILDGIFSGKQAFLGAATERFIRLHKY
ncbi:MAG: hypothetical protein ACOYL6_11600 [Bacteriovoracaceae bacterium]